MIIACVNVAAIGQNQPFHAYLLVAVHIDHDEPTPTISLKELLRTVLPVERLDVRVVVQVSEK